MRLLKLNSILAFAADASIPFSVHNRRWLVAREAMVAEIFDAGILASQNSNFHFQTGRSQKETGKTFDGNSAVTPENILEGPYFAAPYFFPVRYFSRATITSCSA
jgi:hypothetical protein